MSCAYCKRRSIALINLSDHYTIAKFIRRKHTQIKLNDSLCPSCFNSAELAFNRLYLLLQKKESSDSISSNAFPSNETVLSFATSKASSARVPTPPDSYQPSNDENQPTASRRSHTRSPIRSARQSAVCSPTRRPPIRSVRQPTNRSSTRQATRPSERMTMRSQSQAPTQSQKTQTNPLKRKSTTPTPYPIPSTQRRMENTAPYRSQNRIPGLLNFTQDSDPRNSYDEIQSIDNNQMVDDDVNLGNQVTTRRGPPVRFSNKDLMDIYLMRHNFGG